jgi:hypothetical protein
MAQPIGVRPTAAPEDPTATVAGCGDNLREWHGANFLGTQYGPRTVHTTFHLREDGIANWRVGDRGTTGHDRYELRKNETPYGTDFQIYFVSDEGRGWGDMHRFTLTAKTCDEAGKVTSVSATSEMHPPRIDSYTVSTRRFEPLKRTS